MISGVTSSPVGAFSELHMAPSLGAKVNSPAPPANGFAEVLMDYAANAAGILRQGEAAAIAGVQGSLPLQAVVESVMAAERTLQAGVAVRDKFVSAYLEITRMQI